MLPLCFSNYSQFLSPLTSTSRRRRAHPRFTTTLSVLKTSRPVSEVAVDDVFQDFLRERELNGDIISRISDRIWLRNVVNFDSLEAGNSATEATQSQEVLGEDSEGGFLKLKSTKEWLSGDAMAPVNKKRTLKEIQDDRERRKRLNFLRYEALKNELLYLTVGIGTACSGYCLVALSVQAALSYATGVVFSYVYLQLLCQHADNLSQETVPEIFKKKKLKKIGIRSQDLQDFFERSVKGSSIALSSPRLVFPAAIYGLWELCQHFFHDLFDFQLVPAMVGLFAYKAAALVQVYRDNEDLQFLFPENEEGSAN
ncbi:PREDICTED: uncharacterized protein LOC109244984 [Nicotiana attenuata]|uniref:CGL160/ATPI domain-containing protein n=1 Tax=Nicotiana attenuata TaxID=49451 RepID=A0A314KY09_NICAT|nr:PREDICTED: uncharacterized protein LOC109244984 [Nicotiana attenuata]OIT34200.1 hypothetical protein A4A49_40287 [Nicotiana attenuata]